jgi:hypothetical protein
MQILYATLYAEAFNVIMGYSEAEERKSLGKPTHRW